MFEHPIGSDELEAVTEAASHALAEISEGTLYLRSAAGELGAAIYSGTLAQTAVEQTRHSLRVSRAELRRAGQAAPEAPIEFLLSAALRFYYEKREQDSDTFYGKKQHRILNARSTSSFLKALEHSPVSS
ncbi:TPA: hypothetical protein EYO12_01805 [Candidatus Saccharibacteria bacterium]|nr:hypothetical protein [Candidatus Saccharibacteria bacterium]HIO87452.1 hypothetical protein [Candidatus Saccharibacteria bacterium]